MTFSASLSATLWPEEVAVNQAPTVDSDSALALVKSAQMTTSLLALRDTLPRMACASVSDQHLAYVYSGLSPRRGALKILSASYAQYNRGVNLV